MVPSLSLVIPAFNEERRLPAALRAVEDFQAVSPCACREIIVVDDGSSDATAACAERAKARLERAGTAVRVIRNPGNRGKGYSVRRGMLEAEGDWILFSDADLSTPLAEFDKLYRAALEGPHEIAIGSRALDRRLIGKRQPLFREASGRVFNLHMRILIGLDIADTQCGFKLFSRLAGQAIATRQRIDRFGFDVEQLLLARKLGFTVAEVPVRWNNADDSSVTLTDGLKAFADLWIVKWNDLSGRYS